MDLTQALAVYAAVVATGSMMVALKAGRAAEPRLTVRAELVVLSHPEFTADANIFITNRGRGDITLDEVWLPDSIADARLEEGSMPYRLSGKSTVVLAFAIAGQPRPDFRRNRLRVTVIGAGVAYETKMHVVYGSWDTAKKYVKSGLSGRLWTAAKVGSVPVGLALLVVHQLKRVAISVGRRLR